MQNDEKALSGAPAFAGGRRDIRERIAEFVVRAEFAEAQTKGSYIMDKSRIYQQLQKKEQQINQALRGIKSEIEHFRHIMSRTGALQWREEAEKITESARLEMTRLEESARQTQFDIADQCEKLNRSSMSTVKTVSQIVSASRAADMKKLTVHKAAELQESCERNTRYVHHVVHSFQWRNILLIILLALSVSMVVSLYINNEWPWQAHAEIVRQREAGKILLNSWTQLSHNDQELIIDSA